MKKVLFAVLCVASFNASASVPAVLVSCHDETSITGKLIWVGTYNALGNYVTFTFDHYCPATVQVE